MKNKNLNKDQIEQLVVKAMPKVGQRQDEAIVNEMKQMSREDFEKMLARMKAKDKKKAKTVAFPFWQLAAACAATLLILIGVHYADLGKAPGSNYATIYKTEYKVFDKATFDAGGNTKNEKGALNTAGILEQASHLICEKNSRRSLHKGIGKLESLLNEQNYAPALEHEIHWYLGLAYLKDNRMAKAREEFRQVVYLKSPTHAAKAREMLKKLE